MSQKNRDEHNRWRNKTVAFRVSPEENNQLETDVKLSGLTKQDYITRRLLGREVIVQGNPRYSRHCGSSWRPFWRNFNELKPEQKRIRNCWK